MDTLDILKSDCSIDANVENKNKYICSICIDEIERENIYFLPCGHYYHSVCVNKWMNEKFICPECRHPINISTIDDLSNYNKIKRYNSEI